MDQSKEQKDKSGAISRRSFLKGVSVASVGMAITGPGLVEKAEAQTKGKVLPASGTTIELDLNGKKHKIKVEPRHTLAEVLRDKLGFTGTKVSCDRGACGACTVILDGKTVNSCMTLAVDAVGQKLQTIEGLEQNGKLHPVQQAFVDHDALQCGFCTPGMVMSSKHLLDNNPNPNLDEVKKAVCGNLCRCGTYPKVFDAVLSCKKKGGK